MKCDNYPDCGHAMPLVCLVRRAAEIPDDELDMWLTPKELAEMTARFGTIGQGSGGHPTFAEMCTDIAGSVTRALRHVGVTFWIETECDGNPSVNYSAAQYEHAERQANALADRAARASAHDVLNLARDAAMVTFRLRYGGTASTFALISLARSAAQIAVSLDPTDAVNARRLVHYSAAEYRMTAGVTMIR